MSTRNSPASPVGLYHQALHSFHRQMFRFLAARMLVEDTPPLDFELCVTQNRVVLYDRAESTSQHEASQENHSVQQEDGISQHQAPDQCTLPQSGTPTSAALPHAFPSQVSAPNRPSLSTAISTPYPVKKRALGKADFAADYYMHNIHAAAQSDESMESYMSSVHKDDIKKSIPGPYQAPQTFYSPSQHLTTSHVLPQEAYLQQARAGQGGFGFHTPSPELSAFGGPPFSLYHPTKYTD